MDNAVQGETIGLELSEVTIENGIVTKISDGLKCSYIDNYPSKIMIDGLFEDWDNLNISNDEEGDTSDPNVDIIEYCSTSDETAIYFY